MADRLLVDLNADGRVAVTAWRQGERPVPGPSHDFAWPLAPDILEDLRWYLEDYLQAPFGVYGERGPRVEAALASWGRTIFSAVFSNGPARDIYLRMRTGAAPVEMLFRSASPELLSLPWELIADPARPTPLALDLAGMSRGLPAEEPPDTVSIPGNRLRVLMVISRPLGSGDVGYRMIARPLLERLESVRGDVDLAVLRPPTLEALAAALSDARASGEPFQIVHFDGHGIQPSRPAVNADASRSASGSASEGVLVFEKSDGGREAATASRVAQVLASESVPVVVLNACQSGAVGKDLEAAIATRLLRAGIASVVAMAYSVYATAAAEFMTALYERIFAGDTISSAVTAGRQRMFRQNMRPSPKGELPLEDWIVPVHYMRRDVRFPQARTVRANSLPPLAELVSKLQVARPGTETGDLDANGSFIGRDDLFYHLEVAARLQKVIVVHGPGGTGKTELVKAFGRWWRDTGGTEQPEWVFWYSFEPGIASPGLDGVVAQIGLRLFGPDFSLLEPDERYGIVYGVLAQRRMLLIWDNFEAVRSMPDVAGAAGPLPDDRCTQLRQFLGRMAAHGRSAVIITSRTPEGWLGDIRRIAIGGLAAHEAAEYAGYLLAPYPSAAPRRGRRAFGELMKWLDGHPLSMRLTLPFLDTTEPESLLAGLRGEEPLPDSYYPEETRTTSLPASIGYSFAHLADSTRRLLPAVSLLNPVAESEMLAHFSQVAGVSERFAGATQEQWAEALEDGVRVGLLTRLGLGMYQLHPALPGYLSSAWRREEPIDHDAARAAALRELVIVHAAGCRWLVQQIRSGDAMLAYAVIGTIMKTLGNLLSYSLEHTMWDEALAIGQPLESYLRAQGLEEEIEAWADRVLLVIETPDGAPPALDTPAGELWLLFAKVQAHCDLRRHRLDDAERAYRRFVTLLLQIEPSKRQQQHLGTVYHQLGMTSQAMGHADQAGDWYRQAAVIAEQFGDRPNLASTYHQLGILASSQGMLDEAEGWYRRALDIREELGSKPDMASTFLHLGWLAYQRWRLGEAEDWLRKALAIWEELGSGPSLGNSYHELGIVAAAQKKYDEAGDWYRRALVIKEHLGDKPGLAATYHQLGELTQEQALLAEAAQWYTKALAIEGELGNKLGQAADYHQLGTVAQEQGQFDVAENWYRRALAITEEFDNKPGMAVTLSRLGSLADDRGQPRQALDWTLRSIALFSDFPHPATGMALDYLQRLTTQLGVAALEEGWHQVAGTPLPPAIRRYAETSQGSHTEEAENDA